MLRFAIVIMIAGLICPALALAAESAISGVITDQNTGEPIQYATVQVEGTRLGDISEADGSFRIAHVPPRKSSPDCIVNRL